MTEWIVIVLLLAGGFFSMVAGIGIYRMPDVLMRMHASTKAGTLGVGLVVAGLAVYTGAGYDITRAVLIVAFLLLTAPVSAHLIGRAAYRTGVRLADDTLIEDRPPHRCEPSETQREASLGERDDIEATPPDEALRRP